MKIGILLGEFSVGLRCLDFHYNNIWESSRGLTGTDLTLAMLSSILAKRGYDVHLFTCHAEPHNIPKTWENVKLYNLEDRFKIIDNSFDTLISLNEPNVFFGLQSNAYRICWQFLNDFNYCMPEFENQFDIGLAVCQQHLDYLLKQLPKENHHKWKVLGLGCSPELYKDERVPGRVVWMSSADRGLHNLLMIWPYIKKAVPEACLKIFYHFNYDKIEQIEPHQTMTDEQCLQQGSKINYSYAISEMGQRARYMKYAIEKLKPFGVEHIGSVSRKQLIKEWNEASILGYSCDTVAFAEGFSCSIMESHASFTVPIITDQDCLGEVYAKSGSLMVKGPIKNNLKEYTQLIIKSLTDKRFADSVIDRCRIFAMTSSWDNIVDQMEEIIKTGK